MRNDGGVETRRVGVEDARGLEGSEGTKVGIVPKDALEGSDVDDTGGRDINISRDIGGSQLRGMGGVTCTSLRICKAHPAMTGLEAAGFVYGAEGASMGVG